MAAQTEHHPNAVLCFVLTNIRNGYKRCVTVISFCSFDRVQN